MAAAVTAWMVRAVARRGCATVVSRAARTPAGMRSCARAGRCVGHAWRRARARRAARAFRTVCHHLVRQPRGGDPRSSSWQEAGSVGLAVRRFACRSVSVPRGPGDSRSWATAAGAPLAGLGSTVGRPVRARYARRLTGSGQPSPHRPFRLPQRLCDQAYVPGRQTLHTPRVPASRGIATARPCPGRETAARPLSGAPSRLSGIADPPMVPRRHGLPPRPQAYSGLRQSTDRNRHTTGHRCPVHPHAATPTRSRPWIYWLGTEGKSAVGSRTA